ncbi:dehydrogenase E1 component family protein, partial [Mycobacterium kansasii]
MRRTLQRGQDSGVLHLYVGEEAVAAGSLRALAEDDAVVATYREHAHALLRGIPMTSIMAEMFGKQEAARAAAAGRCTCSTSPGGSTAATRLWPAACRWRWCRARRRDAEAKPRDSMLFGDGAVAEGAFHESLNMAALWNLPVLFLCENNLYAMGTALDRAQSQTDLTVKAASYKVPTLAVDGMDVERASTPRNRVSTTSATPAARSSSSSVPTGSARIRCSTRNCTATGRSPALARARPDPAIHRTVPGQRHSHRRRRARDRGCGGRRDR